MCFPKRFHVKQTPVNTKRLKKKGKMRMIEGTRGTMVNYKIKSQRKQLLSQMNLTSVQYSTNICLNKLHTDY